MYLEYGSIGGWPLYDSHNGSASIRHILTKGRLELGWVRLLGHLSGCTQPFYSEVVSTFTYIAGVFCGVPSLHWYPISDMRSHFICNYLLSLHSARRAFEKLLDLARSTWTSTSDLTQIHTEAARDPQQMPQYWDETRTHSRHSCLGGDEKA
jgi:hypothetical protein